MNDKKMDLAGPGIGNYNDLENILPKNYTALLNKKDTQIAISLLKSYFEENLSKELNLIRVECPLIVDKHSGVNDYLDRDGSRTPVEFNCGLGLQKPIQAQIVQAVTKWKRMALKQFDMIPGEGLYTDMRAVRKDYFLDHDHSSYVDQWDWEKVINNDQRDINYLKNTVEKIWKVFKGSEKYIQKEFPLLHSEKYENLPNKLKFIHAEEILDMFPDLPRKQRENEILQKYPAVFILGIGWPLDDGYPHEMRAADYDDWVTETTKINGKKMHGLNGDILVWNPVTERRHELTSMGVRVTKETLKIQLDMSNQKHFLDMPYHKAIINDEIPLSIGGGIGQSRTYMLLLKKAHLGECSVTVWPEKLKNICEKKNIHVLK
ncbi:MAG: aspartate--ammonia ligase [Candidatus Thermoplasmatota archaeon]|nr:aspartate--ammonia ligase [Candidatus Thermoplasmatota archaeon]